MMDCWTVLGIRPTGDITQIRAAYSEKVKHHHPEDDPEGFMQVRNAYKTALKSVSAISRRTPMAEPPAQTPPPPPVTTPPPTPPPSQPAFDFTQVKGNRPEGQDAPPPTPPPSQPAFDFTQVKGNRPEGQDAPPPTPPPSQSAFDFTQIKGSRPEGQDAPPPTPPPVFDFSALEMEADRQSDADRMLTQDFFAKAMALYKARQCKKVEAWKGLFGTLPIESAIRSQAFVWGYLDFLSATPGLPTKVRLAVIDPFTAKLQAFWQGTELWGEFDVASRVYDSKALAAADKRFRLQLILIALPIAVFLVSLTVLRGATGQQDNSVVGYLTALSDVHSSLSGSIFLSVLVSGFTQLRLVLKTKQTVNRGVSGKSRVDRSMFLMIVLSLVCVLFLIPGYNYNKTAESIDDDLEDIEIGRLQSDVVYIYRGYTPRTPVTTVTASSAQGSMQDDLLVHESLGFNPSEGELLDVNESVQDNLAKGMKLYRITYTTNTKVIVTLEEYKE